MIQREYTKFYQKKKENKKEEIFNIINFKSFRVQMLKLSLS